MLGSPAPRLGERLGDEDVQRRHALIMECASAFGLALILISP